MWEKHSVGTVYIDSLQCGPHGTHTVFVLWTTLQILSFLFFISKAAWAYWVQYGHQTQSSWVRRQCQTQEPPHPRLLGLSWLPDPIQIRSNSLGSSDHATPKRIESSGQTKPKNLVCGPKVLKPAWLSDPCIGSRTIDHGRLGGLSCTIVNCCKKSWIAKIER